MTTSTSTPSITVYDKHITSVYQGANQIANYILRNFDLPEPAIASFFHQGASVFVVDVTIAKINGKRKKLIAVSHDRDRARKFTDTAIAQEVSQLAPNCKIIFV